MQSKLNSPWSFSVEQLVTELKTDLTSGLSDAEVVSRQQQWGLNDVAADQRRSLHRAFLKQFADLMVGLLIVAAIISGFVGEWTDTILIALIVVANATIGFVQEYKAEKAIDALKGLSQPTARVRRNGRLQSVPSRSLVPGDVIEVSVGDIIPADARIALEVLLEMDESPLTGESLPIEKSVEQQPEETPLAERNAMVYAGTAVVRGHCQAIVTATGYRAEIGRIASLLANAENGPTPLQRRLAAMNRWLAVGVILISIAIFAAGVFREPVSSWNNELFSQMVLIAVSLAVAAIPEGLPAVITITLALGSQRMAARNAIIRRLSAVESLGSVDVICSDKTGTLTQNRMVVSEIISANDDQLRRHQLIDAMVLCNNANIGTDGQIVGSATEVALLAAAHERDVDVQGLRAENPRIDEIPFSSETKRMITVHQSPDGQHITIVKGAPDRVLKLCGQASPEAVESLSEQEMNLANSGRRVLAIAGWTGDVSSSLNQEDIRTLPDFIGLIGIVDPARPEAKEAISLCRSAGIRPVMITGDHPGTARAIGSELGLFNQEDPIITGVELDQMSDSELRQRVSHICGYARVSPEHKLRIVQALRAQGHAVAMTGDGINDAPALKQADIGVAMGITGTDVSKEAAEMVLADDNFATIVAAVEEGRVVYDNIRKFVVYLLTANISEVLVLLGAIVSGLPLPLLPIHLLWINLVTDGLPALALGFEPPERNVMQRPPRSVNEGIFSRGVGSGILLMGLAMSLICLLLFESQLGQNSNGDDLARARSMTFYVLAVSQLFYVCGIRSFQDSLLQIGIWTNYRLAAAVMLGITIQLLVLYVPLFQNFFHTTGLTAQELAIATAVALIPFVSVELWKFIRRTSSMAALQGKLVSAEL